MPACSSKHSDARNYVPGAVSFTAPPSRPTHAVLLRQLNRHRRDVGKLFVTARSTSRQRHQFWCEWSQSSYVGRHPVRPDSERNKLSENRQSTSRKLYMRAVTSRLRTLILIVSIVRPKSSAASLTSRRGCQRLSATKYRSQLHCPLEVAAHVNARSPRKIHDFGGVIAAAGTPFILTTRP